MGKKCAGWGKVSGVRSVRSEKCPPVRLQVSRLLVDQAELRAKKVEHSAFAGHCQPCNQRDDQHRAIHQHAISFVWQITVRSLAQACPATKEMTCQ